MASFFEKLKKGMGIDESEKIEEEIEETENDGEAAVSSPAPLQTKPITEKKPARRKRILKPKKIEIGEPAASSPVFSQDKAEEEELPEAKIEEKKPSFAPVMAENATDKKNIETKEEWLEPEGELAIDVYQTENDLIIQSAIAGVKPEDLDISMERDVIAIKGNRQRPFEEKGDYFTQECYWGPFSREIILPAEVDPERTEAVMKDGILTIKIPKILREKLRKIKVRM